MENRKKKTLGTLSAAAIAAMACLWALGPSGSGELPPVATQQLMPSPVRAAAPSDQAEIPPRQEQRTALRGASLEVIRAERAKTDAEFERGRWIERANRGELSAEERMQLAVLLDRHHEAVIAEWELLDATL